MKLRLRLTHVVTCVVASVLSLIAGARALAAQGGTRYGPPSPVCSLRIVRVPAGERTRSAIDGAIIRATVADSAGKPLDIASVSLYGTAHAATTDARGTAVLRVPDGTVSRAMALRVRRVGYAALQSPVTVEPGDTFTATAVLCPSTVVIPYIIRTSTGAHVAAARSDSTARSSRALHVVLGLLAGAATGWGTGIVLDSFLNRNSSRSCNGCDHVYVKTEVLSVPVGAVIGGIVGALLPRR